MNVNGSRRNAMDIMIDRRMNRLRLQTGSRLSGYQQRNEIVLSWSGS